MTDTNPTDMDQQGQPVHAPPFVVLREPAHAREDVAWDWVSLSGSFHGFD